MIPFGPIGRASADQIANPQRLRPSGGGGGDARGVISFLAIPVVVFWIMIQVWQGHLGSVACWAIFLAAVVALWWAAFLTSGGAGLVFGGGFVLLAAYAMSSMVFGNSMPVPRPSAGVIICGLIVFVAVGADQVAVKEERALKVKPQT